MRLGEIKQKLSVVLNENNQIEFLSDPLYGGYRYKIKKYKYIVEAITALEQFSWVQEHLSDEVKKLLHSRNVSSIEVELEQSEFNILNNFITQINTKLPFFVSILDDLVEEQEEKYINIKLNSDKISSLENLNELNKKIDRILKLYSIDGNFEFVSFDKGSDWYVLAALGNLSYLALMAGLSIAEQYFKTKKEYYESKRAEANFEKAKLELQAATNKEKITDKDVEEYIERKLKLFISKEIDKLIIHLNIEDKKINKNETRNKLTKATETLIKILSERSFEIYPSLNPPKYIRMDNNILCIDFKNLPKITKSDTKVLPDGKKEEHGT